MLLFTKIIIFLATIHNVASVVCPGDNSTSVELEIKPHDSSGNCLFLSPYANIEIRAVFNVKEGINSSDLRTMFFTDSFDLLDDDGSVIVSLSAPAVGVGSFSKEKPCLGIYGINCGDMLEPGRNYTLVQALFLGTWLPTSVCFLSLHVSTQKKKKFPF